MGTLGYMSPEQVRGKPADGRSDIFSFGAILYEMLAGRRAFHGDSAADTMSAILKEDPPDLSATNQTVPPGLERIVRHCLEKNPEQRFHSAHDVAFDLESLSEKSAPTAGAAGAPALPAHFAAPLARGGACVGALVAGALVFLALRKTGAPPASYNQLTFRRGTIWSARFGPDGKSVLYSAAWDGEPGEIFVSSPGTPESRSLGLPGAELLAVSPAGDVAAALESRVLGEFQRAGTLARLSSTGSGAPRRLLDDVQFADWSSDGKDFAIVRGENGRVQLQFPIGKVLFETQGWIGTPRLSPKGDRIAFLDHPIGGDDGGSVAVVDLAGKKTAVSGVFGSIQGLAWSRDGSEIWFTAGVANRALYAVSLAGRQRVVTSVTGSLTLQDISRDGRVLMVDEQRRLGLAAFPPGGQKERDLSWLDWSRPAGLSADGRFVLIYESGAGGGAGYSAYLRGTDGSPAVRLGEGQSLALSPDGKWALTLLDKLTNPHLILYPTGAGQPRPLALGDLQHRGGRFFPDSRRLLVAAAPKGRGPALPDRRRWIEAAARVAGRFRAAGDLARRDAVRGAQHGCKGLARLPPGRRADPRARDRGGRHRRGLDRGGARSIRSSEASRSRRESIDSISPRGGLRRGRKSCPPTPPGSSESRPSSCRRMDRSTCTPIRERSRICIWSRG